MFLIVMEVLFFSPPIPIKIDWISFEGEYFLHNGHRWRFSFWETGGGVYVDEEVKHLPQWNAIPASNPMTFQSGELNWRNSTLIWDSFLSCQKIWALASCLKPAVDVQEDHLEKSVVVPCTDVHDVIFSFQIKVIIKGTFCDFEMLFLWHCYQSIRRLCLRVVYVLFCCTCCIGHYVVRLYFLCRHNK